MRAIRLVLLATFVFTLSCLPRSGELTLVEGPSPMHDASWTIINGSPPNAPMHDAVVGLHYYVAPNVYVSPYCSGTLIAEDVVLTAAHCLDEAGDYAPDFQTMSPDNLLIYFGDDPAVDILDHLYFVTETLIHPDYDRFQLLNDIALVRIEAVPTEADPVPALPASLGLTSADIGATINFAGFGDDENGASGVKLQVDGTIDGLGCAVSGCPDGGDPATQLSYSQPNSGPCFGDSGGPAFIDRGGPYVAGITSYGDANCAVYGVSTRPDAYEDWIDDFIGVEPPACEYSGTVSSSNRNDYFEIGAQAAGTLIERDLTWSDASANLDFYLHYWNGSRWKNAATSTDGTPGAFEAISHTVPASRDGFDHRWRVRRRSGTTDYCVEAPFVEPPPETPTAAVGGPYSGQEGQDISFDGSGSTGAIVAWDWDFGDSGTASGEVVSHTYAAPGAYVVTLTVTDDDGDTDSQQTTATVTAAPSCDYTGTVSSSHKNDYIDLGAATAGTLFEADLSWDDATANLDLYLQWHNGSRWKNAARSTNGTPGVPESVSYTVASNKAGAPFRWRIRWRSGAADWCLVE